MYLLKTITRRIAKKIIQTFIWKDPAEESVLSSLKKRPQAPYDFLSRYEKILSRTFKWEEINFENKIFFELGCGPHLGFGPLAIFLGAKKFIAADPTSTEQIFNSEILKDKYFRILHKDLEAVYGHRDNFENFFLRLQENTVIYKSSREALENHLNKVDIQITNSCLEHIDNLSDTLKDLKLLLSKDGRYLHGIDFGNHRKTKNPFDGIYELTREEYIQQFGGKINLFTPSEILKQFNDIGFANPKLTPYYFAKEDFNGTIHKDWNQRLAKTDPFLKFALLAGPIKY